MTDKEKTMRGKLQIVAAVWLLQVVDYIDRVVMGFAGPSMMQSLHIGPKTFGSGANVACGRRHVASVTRFPVRAANRAVLPVSTCPHQCAARSGVYPECRLVAAQPE